MASKVNTKLVITLVLAFGAAAVLVGGLYMMKERGNAKRSVARAEQALAEGDLERAYDHYGRAVNKEPVNPVYLAKLEEVLLQIRPANIDQARQKYAQRIGILRHVVTYHPDEAEAHLKLLREMHTTCRQINQPNNWQELAQAAQEMLKQVPESDPARAEGMAYLALAKVRVSQIYSAEELADAVRQAEDAVKADPKSDLAWAALIVGRGITVQKMRTDGQARSVIDAELNRLDETTAQALQALPEGPETARAAWLALSLKQSIDRTLVTSEQVAQAADRLNALISPATDPGLVGEAATIIASSSDDGINKAIEMMLRYLEANPNALDKRLFVAQFQYTSNQLDAAAQTAQQVIESEPLPVSYLAGEQFGLRKQAASLILDIHTRRWQDADAAGKPAQLKLMHDARDQLAALVTDTANDPYMLEADGKIAFAGGDYPRATSLFDELVRKGFADAEVFAYSAACLEQVGQIGLAHERISQAVSMRPYTAGILSKARLELNMRRFDDAKATVAQIPPEALKTQQDRDLVQTIMAQDPTGAPDLSDPIVAALNSANEALVKSEPDLARTRLLAALEGAPDERRLLIALTQVELQRGQPDKAREYLDKALAQAPDDVFLKKLDTAVKFSDPIEATRQYITSSVSNERDRAIQLLGNMASIVHRQEMQAQRLEAENNPAAATKARDLAARAAAEAKTHAEDVRRLAPECQTLLDYDFTQAVTAKDWTAAEQLVARARSADFDQADGLIYKGRMEMLRGDNRAAAQTLEAATDRVPYSASAWRFLALAYQNIGDFGQAQRAYEQAYRCNPNDVEGAMRYVQVLVRTGDRTRALAILQAMRLLAPHDRMVRDSWLDLEALAGDRQLALRERRAIYARDPDDVLNASRLVAVLGDTPPTRESLLDESGQEKYSAQRWTRMTESERTEALAPAREKWTQESEAILDTLQERAGNDVTRQFNVVTLRAGLMFERGEIGEGERLIRDFVEARPDAEQSAAMLITLGRYQIQSKHFTEAIATLKRAVAVQDPKRLEADFELANLYLNELKMPKEALDHLKKVEATAPTRDIRERIVMCLTELQDFDGAEQKLAQTGREHGDTAILAMLAAGIAEGRGDLELSRGNAEAAERRFAEHREALARAQQLEPGDPRPRILLARSFLKEYRRTKSRPSASRPSALDDALFALEQADKIRAGDTETRLVRADVLIEKNQGADAANELRRLLERSPNHIEARRTLINMLVDDHDLAAAMEVIDEAISLNPTLAIWHNDKGELYKFMPGERDAVAALQSFEEAYRLAPSALALLKVVDLMFVQQEPDFAAALEKIEARPDDLAHVPQLREYYVRALVGVGRRDEALEHARLAYAKRRELIDQGLPARPVDITKWYEVLRFLFPESESNNRVPDAVKAEAFAMELCGNKPDVHELRALSLMWMLASGKSGSSRGIELQRQALEMCPPDDNKLKASLYLELANYLLVTDGRGEAARLYETVVGIQPDNVEALNNLAYLTAEELHEPAKALPWAKKALELQPASSSVLDTLGRVYFLMGDYANARQHFNESLKLRETAEVYANLAETFIQEGDLDQAQRQLDSAEKLKPNVKTGQKIESLRDDIRKRRESGEH